MYAAYGSLFLWAAGTWYTCYYSLNYWSLVSGEHLVRTTDFFLRTAQNRESRAPSSISRSSFLVTRLIASDCLKRQNSGLSHARWTIFTKKGANFSLPIHFCRLVSSG